MNFLVVDDEPLQLREIASVLRRLRPEAEIFPYTWPDEALESAKAHPMDVAFLDIQMGGMTGLELAVRLKKVKPDIHIIFVTGYADYAVDAFAMHATGYLLKPVTEEAVSRELTFVYNSRPSEKRIQVKTFGGFDVYADGQPVRFRRAKAKELLAYLVDRRGSSVTTGEAYAALFEDAADTPSGKSYFRTILHELIAALKKAQAEEILVKGHNSFAVDPETFDCDYYRFLQGDPAAVNAFQNDYMQSYSWAEIRNAELDFWEYREPERR